MSHQRPAVGLKRLRHEVPEDGAVDDALVADIAAEMPRTRAECPTSRPCPWLGCRYHLALDVTPAGSLVVALDDWEQRDTCALDVAERAEPPTLAEVGGLMGLTRERVRQIEERALDAVAAAIGGGS